MLGDPYILQGIYVVTLQQYNYRHLTQCHLPMCQRELGAGTEYGLLLVKPAGHLLAPPNGSIPRSVLRIRSLLTFRPLLRKLPHIICTPE